MAKREEKELKLVEKIQKQEVVTISDVTCPICLCILVEPVEMPCRHVICMPCYQENVTHANICCPVCRHRLSTWARKASRENKLINFIIWKYIKEKFSEEVRSREEGEDILDPDEVFPCLPNHQFAEKGEIKSEFDAVLAKENEAREREARMEEEQSKDLITKLQMEYEREQRQAREDEEFARTVHNTPSPGKENRLFKKKQVRGPLDSFISSSQQSSLSNSQPSSQSPQVGSQSSQSVLSESPILSQRLSNVRDKGGNNAKSKTLFKSSNIASFLKENKMQSNSNPLSLKTENSQNLSKHSSPDIDDVNEVSSHKSSAVTQDDASASTKDEDKSSPDTWPTQPLESSLLLFLDDSPSLMQNSSSRKLDAGHTSCSKLSPTSDFLASPSSQTNTRVDSEKPKQTILQVESKGEKCKNSNICYQQKSRGHDQNETSGGEGETYVVSSKEAQSLDEDRDIFNDDESSEEFLKCSAQEKPASSSDRNNSIFLQDTELIENNTLDVKNDIMSDKSTEKVDSSPNLIEECEDTGAGPSTSHEQVSVLSSQGAGPSTSHEQVSVLSSQSLRIIQEISNEGDFDDTFLEEQKRIAEQIEQEKKDLEMALKLQNELNKQSRSVDRRKGSENGYSFRTTTPKSAAAGAGSSRKRRRSSGGSGSKSVKKGGKQLSLQESFKKTKLNFQESDEF